LGGILVKKSTGFPTTRTNAATSPLCNFCRAPLLIDQNLIDLNTETLE